MKITKLDNGNLLVPIRVSTGESIGDALTEITPTHPDYQKWLHCLNKFGDFG